MRAHLQSDPGPRMTDPLAKNSGSRMGDIDSRYRDLLTTMANAGHIDACAAALIESYPFDHQLGAASIDAGLLERISATWSQFHNHPRDPAAYAQVEVLAEWLDGVMSLSAHELVEVVRVTEEAIRDDLDFGPVHDEFIEALVGPESDAVFALHWIRATQLPGDSAFHVVEHSWRSLGAWDLDFPVDEPRWAAESERLAAAPELVARVKEDKVVTREFELVWDLADAYRLPPQIADDIVRLFDDGVSISAGLMRWTQVDPSVEVSPDTVSPELFVDAASIVKLSRQLSASRARRALVRWFAEDLLIPAGVLTKEMVNVTGESHRVTPAEPPDSALAPAISPDVAVELDYGAMLERWQHLALELNSDSQWAHACSWMLAARLAEMVDHCTFGLDWYPTGIGSVLFLTLEKDGRSAEILMNRAGSIRGHGFDGRDIGWGDPSILTMPWVWFTCLAPEGRRQVLDEIHRGLALEHGARGVITRQVIGFDLLGQILASKMGDVERWWTHNSFVHEFYGPTEDLLPQSPRIDGRGDELVCVFRGDEPRAWVHDGWLWVDGQRIDAYDRYHEGEPLASIAALLGN